MKLTQTVVQKTFHVEYKGKVYYVDYVNSDGQELILLNRDDWEITDENHEEIGIYLWNNSSKKEKRRVRSNQLLADKLITFCIKHFNTYDPLKANDGKPFGL